MDVNRRNLMKGVLTGGTLLALGIPPGAFAGPPPGRAGRFGLLLGNTPMDAAFAAGIRTAYAAHANRAAGAGPALRVVKLKGGLLNDYEMVGGLLEKSRDTRWIAVMDDGSAAVFTELARNAGARLILLGSHASSNDDTTVRGGSPGIPGLRHVWAAASPSHSAGGILASQLIALVRDKGSFSIVENFFSMQAQADSDRAAINGFVPGFMTYRLDEPDTAAGTVELHCSGLSPANGCELLGWNRAGRWMPASQQISPHETAASVKKEERQPYSAGWVESVGYAVMAAALGTGALGESCSSRAFVHQSAGESREELPRVAERFTSFVIDI
ncbi:hypothetical protein [Nitrosospira lacus]|nr:hypothetical protein [Nitrosospira lacus]